jgi:Tol biopolymer transport system component
MVGAALSSSDPTLHEIWTGPGVTVQGMPSPDGRWLSCMDTATGDIALRDLQTGTLRPLTGHRAGKEFAYFSAIAPDSSRIAYAWFNDAGFYELRLVSTQGGTPRVLYRNEEAGFVQPADWTPDGKSILTLFFRKDNTSQIALVSAQDGTVRVLKSLNWVYPKKMDVSPDGRWIVYDAPASGAGINADIYLLAVDGSREHVLIDDPADDNFPLWTPDGRSVVFSSNRLGSPDVWTVPVRDGKPAGPPTVIRRGLARFLPLGITSDGRLFFAQRKGAQDVFLAATAGAEPPRRLASRFAGSNSAPVFSADGEWLAYLTRAGTENYGTQAHAITIRSLVTGKERQLVPKLAHIERLRWSPDGEWLLASGANGKGRSGVFRVNVASGELRPVALEENFSLHGLPADWLDRERLLLGGPSVRERNLVTGKERLLEDRPAALVAAGPSLAFFNGREVVVLGKGAVYSGAVTALAWLGSDLLIGTSEGILRNGRKVDLPGYDGGPISVHGSTLAFSAGRTLNEIWSLKLP